MFNDFVLGHMLEVVFQPFVSCSVQCTVLLYSLLLLYLFRIKLSHHNFDTPSVTIALCEEGVLLGRLHLCCNR